MMKYKLIFDNVKFWIKQPYVIIRNLFLIRRYPWLSLQNDWDDPIYNKRNYLHLWAEPDRGGWNKAFFYPLMESIRKEAKKAGIMDNLHTSDYKSKYGGLRFYLDGANSEINDIIHIYETMSEYICEFCGKPDVGYTDGWITPICKKCYNKCGWKTKSYEEVIKGTGRIPNWMEYYKYEHEKTILYKVDITKVANKIRRKWNIFHPFRRTPYA